MKTKVPAPACQARPVGRVVLVEQSGEECAVRGVWQGAADYEVGSLVTAGKRAYVAVKAIRSGGSAPSRDGGGWEPLFDSSQLSGGLNNIAEEVASVIKEIVEPFKDRLAILENELSTPRT